MSVAPESSEAFRRAFRRHPAGVAIVSAVTPDGPAGLTASSVASVSIAPLALSFSVTALTGSAALVLAQEAVTVHLLSEQHELVARDFATNGAPRFTTQQGWRPGALGPILPDAAARLSGRITGIVPVGSARIVVVEIDAVELGPAAAPLVYADRSFHRLALPDPVA